MAHGRFADLLAVCFTVLRASSLAGELARRRIFPKSAELLTEIAQFTIGDRRHSRYLLERRIEEHSRQRLLERPGVATCTIWVREWRADWTKAFELWKPKG